MLIDEDCFSTIAVLQDPVFRLLMRTVLVNCSIAGSCFSVIDEDSFSTSAVLQDPVFGLLMGTALVQLQHCRILFFAYW